jgi:hypothetical protein
MIVGSNVGNSDALDELIDLTTIPLFYGFIKTRYTNNNTNGQVYNLLGSGPATNGLAVQLVRSVESWA